ncbi:MAG: hypothetical protein CSA62_15520 [Planctomycetota bacterium]|nr:MAG: hypothetical protein CSA62_15520 [Planctomycetota bacterium]
MGRKHYIVSGSLVILVLVFVVFSRPPHKEKRSALVVVGNAVAGAKYHHVPMIATGASALRARHNLKVIAQATEYMGTFGSNTGLFRDIAKVAARCDHECPQLLDVLDLAARSKEESWKIVRLAEEACRCETPEDYARWHVMYDRQSEAVTYPSVAAAIEAEGRN